MGCHKINETQFLNVVRFQTTAVIIIIITHQQDIIIRKSTQLNSVCCVYVCVFIIMTVTGSGKTRHLEQNLVLSYS